MGAGTHSDYWTSRVICISGSPGMGWEVWVAPAHEPELEGRWFADQDIVCAFAQGLAAATGWPIEDHCAPEWECCDEGLSPHELLLALVRE